MSSTMTKPIRVLLVEEEQSEGGREGGNQWQQTVAHAINSGLFEARRVTHLAHALTALDTEAFDVVLLDLSLPDSEGNNTFLQVYSRAPEVPIVIASFVDDRVKAIELLREGAQDYLLKHKINSDSLRRALIFAIERHRSRLVLQQLSFYDELTGLLNRRGFLSMAQQQLKIAQRENWELVMLFADLDRLKVINDSFGHTEGDRALETVALILKETFRTSDLLARLGGDEFIVLALNAPATGVQRMLDRLKANLERRNAQNSAYQLSLSLGIARFDPGQDLTLEEMIIKADKALYEDKRRKGH